MPRTQQDNDITLYTNEELLKMLRIIGTGERTIFKRDELREELNRRGVAYF